MSGDLLGFVTLPEEALLYVVIIITEAALSSQY